MNAYSHACSQARISSQGRTFEGRTFEGRTSAALEALVADRDAHSFSIAEIVDGLGERAFGLLLVAFAIPCMLPSPPPVPLICVTVLSLVGASLILGRSTVWFPRFVARKSLSTRHVQALVTRVLPTARRIERLCRPRWSRIAGRGGRALFGALIILLGAIVLLPIPIFGNFTPGLAIAVIGLGLAERDGAVLLAGVGLVGVAIAVTAAVAWASFSALFLVLEWGF